MDSSGLAEIEVEVVVAGFGGAQWCPYVLEYDALQYSGARIACCQHFPFHHMPITCLNILLWLWLLLVSVSTNWKMEAAGICFGESPNPCSWYPISVLSSALTQIAAIHVQLRCRIFTV